MTEWERLHKGLPVISSARHISNFSEVGDFDFHGYVYDEGNFNFADYRSTKLESGERVFTGSKSLEIQHQTSDRTLPIVYDMVFCLSDNQIAHMFRITTSDRDTIMGVHEVAVNELRLTSCKETIKQKILDEIIKRGLASPGGE